MGVYQFSPNLPTPINVGSTEQTKTGNLIVEGVLRLGQFTTANAPSGTEGALYFDTTDNTTKIYSSSAWGDLAGGWDGIIPNYTTAQRNALSLVDGLIVFNTTDNAVQIYSSDVWRNVGAKLSLAATCRLDGDCDSTHCINGYCCNTGCTGNCDRCNIVGSIGICTDVASDCTGNCDICSSGNCAADDAVCTGNCDVCLGSGVAYNCAATADGVVCSTCQYCSGSGTAYTCTNTSNGNTGYNCTAEHYRCDGVGTCTNPTTTTCFNFCPPSSPYKICSEYCLTAGYVGCTAGYWDTCVCTAGYERACTLNAISCKCWKYLY